MDASTSFKRSRGKTPLLLPQLEICSSVQERDTHGTEGKTKSKQFAMEAALICFHTSS